MKTKLTFLTFLITFFSIAQNGINYKAVIKDNLGNVIANSSIDIKFQILESDALVNVYEESHSPMTDNNGIIIINIGEGTIIGGVFSDLNWGENNHYLNVKINTGSGFIDMGTTHFSAVPYAFHAKKAANVKGLEAIDEGNGIGWRLVDRNPDNYDNIGGNAIDLSFINDSNLGLGAKGDYAFSLGLNGTASGEHALVFGNQNYALNDYAIALGNNNNVTGLNSTAIGGINQVGGDYSFAAGLQNEASENYTVALGTSSTASAEYAFAMGQNTTASGNNSTAFGRSTEAIGANSVAMGRSTEALGNFSFAFGDSSEAQGNNSIAMGDDAFATNDYAVAIGRDAFASGQSSFALGSNTEASGDSSTAMGQMSEASGETSSAFGNQTQAIGFSSTSFGLLSQANGFVSTAMGGATDASGQYSTTMGFATEASGNFSIAMGRSTIATSTHSIAIGRYNIGGGSPFTWLTSDPLFEIGIGNFNDSNNALTVLKNGNIGIGTHTPQELLHISGGRLRIGTETIEDTGNNRLSFNADLLPDVNNAMQLGNSSFRWQGLWATDGTINTSDRRSKTNITSLNYGLKDVIKLNPVSFNWKNKPNENTKIGLIAQDLLKVIPEVVKTHDWETDEKGNKSKEELDRMGVYYSDLIPVLINAIKEQNKMIISQKKDISELKNEVSSIKEFLTELKATHN